MLDPETETADEGPVDTPHDTLRILYSSSVSLLRSSARSYRFWMPSQNSGSFPKYRARRRAVSGLIRRIPRRIPDIRVAGMPEPLERR